MTWDKRLYFPSEGRIAEESFALKNPTASAGFEPANCETVTDRIRNNETKHERERSQIQIKNEVRTFKNASCGFHVDYSYVMKFPNSK